MAASLSHLWIFSLETLSLACPGSLAHNELQIFMIPTGHSDPPTRCMVRRPPRLNWSVLDPRISTVAESARLQSEAHSSPILG